MIGRWAQRIRGPVLWLLVLGAAIVWLIPLFFIAITAFKPQMEIISQPPFSLPSRIAWENVSRAWETAGLGQATLNSAIVSFVKVPIGLALSALAAYALARIPFRGVKLVVLLIVLGAMIPIQIVIAPLFKMVNDLGLLNTYVGLILPYIGFGVPYQVFVLYAFFRVNPKVLDEAASIDGANHLRIFWSVHVPIMLPVLAALLILDFVATWNEFAIASFLMQRQDMHTVPLTLMRFQTQFTADYGPLNVTILLATVPIILVYVAFQRYFVSGLSAGAVKG